MAHATLSFGEIGSTAAAADEHQSDDQNPDPIVIEHVAQTVIHSVPPKI